MEVAREITAQKKAAQVIQDAAEKYRSLFESTREGIMFSDSEFMFFIACF